MVEEQVVLIDLVQGRLNYCNSSLQHELMSSGLSWPTLDQPFRLGVGNTSLSITLSYTIP